MKRQTRKTERLTNLAYAHKSAGTLIGAIEVGLFTAISEGNDSVEKLAHALDLPVEITDRLIIACKALDLIEESGGVVKNTDDVERYLVRTSRTYSVISWLTNSTGGTRSGRACVNACLAAENPSRSRFTSGSCKTPKRPAWRSALSRVLRVWHPQSPVNANLAATPRIRLAAEGAENSRQLRVSSTRKAPLARFVGPCRSAD